ncbi:MAG: hypothetical protein KF713_06415 [Turneriella sp.]|nr:hypothetical protein [Turneriella sp.]
MATGPIAISPCPNDTFAFYAIIHAAKYKVDFLDIEELNRALIAGKYDIAKGSFAIMQKIAPEYEILPVGAAIGKGVGPVFVGSLKPGGTVALPGENTTAHRLYKFWQSYHPDTGLLTQQMPFFEMLPALKAGKIDAAVLIHEGRFVYPGLGLKLISDLGAFWEEKTGAMIPLGCIYARKSLPAETKSAFVAQLKDSLMASGREYRGKSPRYLSEILPYMRKRAQEKEDQVVEAHVDTYVTADTLEMGAEALKSVDVFREKCLQ